MHALPAVGDPLGQRRLRHGLAGGDVLLDPLRDLLPARGLPQLEGTARPAETPADRKIHVARAVRDVTQVHGDVVEHVAENGPEELRLWMARRAQLRELVGGILLLEDLLHFGGDVTGARAIVLEPEVEDLDVLAL